MNFFKRLIITILTWESRLILRKYRPFIVAVTCSVGKTSTKDAIYDVIKNSSRYVRKSEKSMNSDIGLPLTVIGVPNAWHSIGGWLRNIRAGLRLIVKKADYPDCLILEIGADHPGDIKKTVKWLHPDIAVITRVSKTPVHVEFFSSPEQVFEEKASLALGAKKGGTVILYADDDKVMSIADKVKTLGESVISFGLTDAATVKAKNYEITYRESNGARVPTGFSFMLESAGSSYKVSLDGIIGENFMYPLLAAASVGLAKGIALEKIAQSLNSYDAPKGRMNLIPGKNGCVIIDDTYNSSPDAVVGALGTLKSISLSVNGRSKPQKIAILGDMMELGKYSAEEHRKIGKIVPSAANELITVGQRSRATADEALKNGLGAALVKSFDSSEEATSQAPLIAAAGNIILVKGSQSVRMEHIVKALMAEPVRASELLVRQEREWLLKK